jgi:hypothetical protein
MTIAVAYPRDKVLKGVAADAELNSSHGTVFFTIAAPQNTVTASQQRLNVAVPASRNAFTESMHAVLDSTVNTLAASITGGYAEMSLPSSTCSRDETWHHCSGDDTLTSASIIRWAEAVGARSEQTV